MTGVRQSHRLHQTIGNMNDECEDQAKKDRKNQSYNELLSWEQRRIMAINRKNQSINVDQSDVKLARCSENYKKELVNQMKVNLRSGQYEGVLSNMRSVFQESVEEMVTTSDKKLTGLIKAFNQLKFERSKAEDYCAKKRKEYEEMSHLIIQGNEEYDKKQSELEAKSLQVEEKKQDAERQKERMLKIIEICNKNKDYNED